jgi:hypothetical protein
MTRIEELDRRAWAGAIVDDCLHDVDEPVRAIAPPVVPQAWSQRGRDILVRLSVGALR